MDAQGNCPFFRQKSTQLSHLPGANISRPPPLSLKNQQVEHWNFRSHLHSSSGGSGTVGLPGALCAIPTASSLLLPSVSALTQRRRWQRRKAHTRTVVHDTCSFWLAQCRWQCCCSQKNKKRKLGGHDNRPVCDQK